MAIFSSRKLVLSAVALPLVVGLVLVSSVDVTDARKLKQLAPPYHFAVNVGDLYALNGGGEIDLTEPRCRVRLAEIEQHTETNEYQLVVRNKLGYAVPTATRWLKGIVAWSTGTGELGGQPTAPRTFAYHTKAFGPLTVSELSDEGYAKASEHLASGGPGSCARWIARQYERNRCVVMVWQVAMVDGKPFGVRHNSDCFVPTEAEHRAAPLRRDAALGYLSHLKHSLELVFEPVG